MTPYFSTPERVAALEAAVSAWIGTPYVVSGAVRGHGASCHRLAGAILADAGFHLHDIPEKGDTRLREFKAAMMGWLDGHEAFTRVALDDVQAGDVLLCEFGIGHIGLALDRFRAVQVLRHQPAHVVSLSDPNVRERILAVYRPIDLSANGQ